MLKYIYTIAIIFLSFKGFAQQEINLEEIKNHIGDSVKIKAKIYGGKFLENVKGTPTFLNVGGNYPNAPLTLVIWGDLRSQFKTTPEKTFKQHAVVVSRKITLYKNKPEIIIYNSNQIEDMVPVPNSD